MAGDWIKMRVDLYDNNKVWLLSSNLGLDEFSIIGRLHRIWSWADKNSKDGTLRATEAMIDRLADKPGFAKALMDVGWLKIEGETTTFPNFDRHNGESAKKRATESERKRQERLCPQISGQNADNSRTKRGQGSDKTRTTRGQNADQRREEESREEHSSNDECNPPNPPKGGSRKRGELSFDAAKVRIPPALDTPEFNAKWQEWCAFRRSVRKLISEKACDAQLNKLCQYGPVLAIEAINRAIENDYQGLFPKREPPQPQSGDDRLLTAHRELFGATT